MYYVLIQGSSYRGLDFEARERIRERLRERLEANGIRFLEYTWVWDEQDRCLLVVGEYERIGDASLFIKTLGSMGFETCVRTRLPGD